MKQTTPLHTETRVTVMADAAPLVTACLPVIVALWAESPLRFRGAAPVDPSTNHGTRLNSGVIGGLDTTGLGFAKPRALSNRYLTARTTPGVHPPAG